MEGVPVHPRELPITEAMKLVRERLGEEAYNLIPPDSRVFLIQLQQVAARIEAGENSGLREQRNNLIRQLDDDDNYLKFEENFGRTVILELVGLFREGSRRFAPRPWDHIGKKK